MPFIVTTKRPNVAAPDEPCACEKCQPSVVSRLAVATLEDARRLVFEARIVHHGSPWREYEARISESGGTVGPLPDGTSIQVEPVFQPRMRRDLRIWGSSLDTVRAANDLVAMRWLAAFNAKFAPSPSVAEEV